jgi:hypothetical protein
VHNKAGNLTAFIQTDLTGMLSLAESEFQIDKNPYLAYGYIHQLSMDCVTHLTKPKTGCNHFQHDKKERP